MTPRVPNRTGRFFAAAALSLLLLVISVPSSGSTEEPFPGYPGDIRAQALRVVDAAAPGSPEMLAREVRSLRKMMFDHGILSLNAIPDMVFERAAKEGWKRHASGALREVAKVAPLSVSLWAWLIREDLLRREPDQFLEDLSGLWGTMRMYGPALMGVAAWGLLFSSAAACWFAAWASVALLLRARPALTADLARLLKRFPRPEIPAAFLVLAFFLVPIFAGVGLAVCAVFWIALSAGYLRRGELVIATTAILLLAGVFLSGGGLYTLSRMAGDSRKGGWLGGEGYFPRSWPEATVASEHPLSGPQWEGMVKFSRARAEMQKGNLDAAERMWSERIREDRETAGSYNNRGIVRAWRGKTGEALSDFEAAMARSPSGGPAWWNAYQMYLQSFQLEKAGKVQSTAWASVEGLSPFDYRADEMTHGEMVPSPLTVEEIWKNLFRVRDGWLREAGKSPIHALFFRPLPGGWVIPFLAAGWLWAAVWKLLSKKVWLHSTCRSCGTRTMVVGLRETADICNSCRAQVGMGFRGGEERERRVLNIALHRRYVRACSVLFPGTGALWAGKDLRAMIYGLALCLTLGVLTVSLGEGSMSRTLISDMEILVVRAAFVCGALLWAGGAWWGWRAFERLQLRYNVAKGRS